MESSRTAVITGVGVVSPIGIGKEAFWNSLEKGRSGVRRISLFDATHMPVNFGGEISQFDPKLYIQPRKSIKVMCRESQFAVAAAAMAMEDCGLSMDSVDPDRFGVIFGSEMFYGEISEMEDLYRHCVIDGRFHFDQFGMRIQSDLYPLWLLKYLPNMPPSHIGIAYDARGPNNTIVQGEASGLLSLIEAVCVIQRGDADVMISGGTGSRLNLTPLMYRGDGNLSHRVDDPAGASRPFDRFRDGMVNGEGAAAFVIEERHHAESRGARLLAQIVGYGRAFEANRNGRPRNGDAIRRSIVQAMSGAALEPHQIGHVNANGLSTREEDAIEAAAVHNVLGQVPVTAPKSFFGNLGAGTGAVEMVASVIALERGQIPITLNYSHPDPCCPVHVVHGGAQATDKPAAVVLSQSTTGQAAAVVLSRP